MAHERDGLVHGDSWNGDDRTLCGIADEGVCMKDELGPPIYAKTGELITCDDCRRLIDYARKFKRYRQPPTTLAKS